MDSPIKLAVVGVGWAGSRHADAITELRASDDRIEIACFVDNDPEHLEETASKYGVLQTYPSLGDALVGRLIAAVDLASPSAPGTISRSTPSISPPPTSCTNRWPSRLSMPGSTSLSKSRWR